jgi:hypothetical protein
MANTRQSDGGGERSNEALVARFEGAMGEWLVAIRAHVMAPPDLGFAERLSQFAAGARSLAVACRDMGRAGYVWPSTRKADSEPPYELRPGTGRRGPEELWRRFDRATRAMILVAAGTDLLEVADAYDDLAAIAEELAAAVAAEDAEASGASSRRTRARRSA